MSQNTTLGPRSGLSLVVFLSIGALLPMGHLGAIPPVEKPPSKPDEPRLEFRPKAGKDEADRFVVSGLSPAQLRQCSDETVLASLWTIKVDGRPGLLGKSVREGDTISFRPRFPLAADLVHWVEFRPPGEGAKPLRLELTLPKADGPAPTVTAVHPSGGEIPENTLKFYVHFSQPMKRGEIYQKIQVVRKNGGPVAQPFLQLDEELWDPAMTRATLLLDPGRIKRGVQGRMEEGTILQEGKEYTLRIDASLEDAQGRKLGQAVVKEFKVGPPALGKIDPADWSLTVPRDPSMPLVVRFPGPLDHALALREISVRTDQGDLLPGKPSMGTGDASWEFRPTTPWKSGVYRLQIGPDLEDLAGNRSDRPFDAPPKPEGNGGGPPPLSRIDFRIK